MIIPVIRYVGGKMRVADKIVPHFPDDILEYREPMIGGGGVLLGLLQNRRRPKKIAIGDLDFDIANMWKQVIGDPDGLMEGIIKKRDEVLEDGSEEGILDALSNFGLSGCDAAANTIIMNMIRRWGNYGAVYEPEIAVGRLLDIQNRVKYRIYACSNLLGDAEVYNEGYEWALENEGEGVCVFLDPPYYDVAQKDGYYKGHKGFDFEKLTRDLVRTKHKFVMTLDKSEYSEGLREHFNVEGYKIFYSMSGKWVEEYIIKNF